MPELLPVLDRLAAALDRTGALTVLTHTGLKPFFAGCAQTAIAGALVRNYDFRPDECERTAVASAFRRPVIGMNDLFWGLLDGMNDAGLAVSLTFGGRFVVGRGESILLIVRYLLETCASVAEAWTTLQRLPSATVQNLTLVDAHEAATVHVGPDRPPVRVAEACTTNHQDVDEPTDDHDGLQSSLLRMRTLRAATDAATRHAATGHAYPVDEVVAAMLRPPLYQTRYDNWCGTLYTAAYRPVERRVTYIWPGQRWEQSFDGFSTGTRTVAVG
jgi:predicted choloylglycine hydrolase